MQRLTSVFFFSFLLWFILCPNTSLGQNHVSIDFAVQIQKSTGSVKKRYKALQKLIDSKSTMDELSKLKRVNRFYNLFQFVSDMQFKGQSDYWQSPYEFIRAGAGDCEDFSIAKYFTLLKMGVPSEKLKIVYAKSKALNQAHMVLAYYETPSSEPLILDNLVGKILPASKRPDLLPVYSFNIDGLWLVQNPRSNRRVGSSNRLRKWKDLLKRMEREGDNQ